MKVLREEGLEFGVVVGERVPGDGDLLGMRIADYVSCIELYKTLGEIPHNSLVLVVTVGHQSLDPGREGLARGHVKGPMKDTETR